MKKNLIVFISLLLGWVIIFSSFVTFSKFQNVNSSPKRLDTLFVLIQLESLGTYSITHVKRPNIDNIEYFVYDPDAHAYIACKNKLGIYLSPTEAKDD